MMGWKARSNLRNVYIDYTHTNDCNEAEYKHQERKYHNLQSTVACFQLVFKAEFCYEGRKSGKTPGGAGMWDESAGSPDVERGGNGLPGEGTV